MDQAYLLLAVAILSLVLFSLNQRLASPVIAIFVRWLRWLLFSLGGAFLAVQWGWSDRPFWALAIGLFLVWFMLETIYNWLAISALSQSSLPLFPHYVVNTSGEEWPTHPRLLKVREWLRGARFTQVQALKAELGGGIFLRISVYQDQAARTRIHVTFVPQANGAISVCYTLTTGTADGMRYVTDNLYLPFGGFYPENWLVKRTPWSRSLPRLLALHRAPCGRRRRRLRGLAGGAGGGPQPAAVRTGTPEHGARIPSAARPARGIREDDLRGSVPRLARGVDARLLRQADPVLNPVDAWGLG